MRKISPREYDFCFDSTGDCTSWYEEIMGNNPTDNSESPDYNPLGKTIMINYLHNPAVFDDKKPFWFFWERKVLSNLDARKNNFGRK